MNGLIIIINLITEALKHQTLILQASVFKTINPLKVSKVRVRLRCLSITRGLVAAVKICFRRRKRRKTRMTKGQQPLKPLKAWEKAISISPGLDSAAAGQDRRRMLKMCHQINSSL